MNTKRFWTYGLVVAAFFALLFSLPQTAMADEGDPPGRVGRISFLKGSVSFEPAGTSAWTNATLNRPMTIGDRIWTDSDARAEIQAGPASMHLNERTGVSFLNLDDRTVQVRLSEGALNMRVREIDEGEIYEVDTPNLAFTVTRAGAFRFDVNENGDYTGVTVFRGEGEVTAGGRSYTVREGERADFTGVDNPRYDITRAPGPDAFDRWAMERDLRGDRSVSARYVSRDVVGYEDLDDYGTWQVVPDYGPVWYPSYVYAGWAPYRYGYWGWIDPWGWTWIDYAPWGFAPFHYGRWAFIGGRWGWCPGPLFVRPIYSPAFVSFVSFGHSSFFGFGFGAPVAWFPLGFGDPFFPWFRCSRTFITNINIRNTRIRNINILNTNIRNVNFVNAHVAGAVTAVPRNVFAGGQRVDRAALRVPGNALRNARFESRVDVNPTRQSRLGGVRAMRVPPAAVRDRTVVSRATPAPNAGFRTRPAMREGTAMARNGRPLPGPAPLARQGERPNGRFGAPRVQPSERLRNDRPPSASRGMNEQMGAPVERAPMAGGREGARPMNAPVDRGARMERADRPPWAGRAGAPGGTSGVDRAPRMAPETRGSSPRSMDRPPSSGLRSFSQDRAPITNRADRPPANRFEGRPSSRMGSMGRSFDAPREFSPRADRGRSFEGRGYSAPPGSYDYSAPRSYSAPSRSYSAPRSYAAPRSYGSSGGRGYSGSARGGGGSSGRGGDQHSHGR